VSTSKTSLIGFCKDLSSAGTPKRLVSMKCHLISICKVTKELINNSHDNYYEAVRIAYSEQVLQEHLGCHINMNQIDMNLEPLWSFTYRIVKESQDIIRVIDQNSDHLLIKWAHNLFSMKRNKDDLKC
jgi:hypothetical protein